MAERVDAGLAGREGGGGGASCPAGAKKEADDDSQCRRRPPCIPRGGAIPAGRRTLGRRRKRYVAALDAAGTLPVGRVT